MALGPGKYRSTDAGIYTEENIRSIGLSRPDYAGRVLQPAARAGCAGEE